MTPRRHPPGDLLASCAAGTLRPGASLVVQAHLARCAECARDAGFYESLGGALLEVETPVAMSPGALDRAAAVLDAAPTAPVRARARASAEAALLPGQLEGLGVGRRRWIAPGVWVTPLRTEHRSRELVYLLRIGSGMVLPRHTHSGQEFTCVLEGSFADRDEVYGPGDFVATDERVEHRPVVGRDGACVCLASTDAPLVMRDVLGRIFQPFAGI